MSPCGKIQPSGIDVARTKLFAFSVGAALAALGGILLAFRQPELNFDAFN